MVIGTLEDLPIGVLDRGLSDAQGDEFPAQPFVVLRQVTEAEWRAFIEADTGQAPHEAPPAGARFYEISTD